MGGGLDRAAIGRTRCDRHWASERRGDATRSRLGSTLGGNEYARAK